MKRIVGVLVVAAVASLVYSCRKDVVVEPPPSLTGDYVGSYTFRKGNLPPWVQGVKVRFTQNTFRMVWDSTGTRQFCDVQGEYEFTNQVTLYATTDQDSNATSQICDKSRSPFAPYGIDQSVANKVTMHSIVSGVDTIDRVIDLTVAK